MTDLRAELDGILEQHFDASVLGRQQCVDDLMKAVESHRQSMAPIVAPPVRSDRATTSSAPPPPMAIVNVIGPPDPPAMGILVEDVRRAVGQVRRHRSRGW